jgi:hypothetical protein
LFLLNWRVRKELIRTQEGPRKQETCRNEGNQESEEKLLMPDAKQEVVRYTVDRKYEGNELY